MADNEFKWFALLAGSWVGILGCYIYVHARTNHVSDKIEDLKDNFNDFRVEVSKQLGTIEALLKKNMKGM